MGFSVMLRGATCSFLSNTGALTEQIQMLINILSPFEIVNRKPPREL